MVGPGRAVFPRRNVAQAGERSQRSRALDPREALVAHAHRDAEVDLEPERRRDLLSEHPAETSPTRIDAADQLALVPAQADSVVAVTGARPPQRAAER